MEASQQEKERLYVLLARYQLGLLSDVEKEEMNALQKKLYGDSTLYRESEFEKITCAPKTGDNYLPPVEESEVPPEAEGGRQPRIIESADKENDVEEAVEELFGEPKSSEEKKKRKIDLDIEEI